MRISNNSNKEDREQPTKQTCSLNANLFCDFLNVSDKLMRKKLKHTRHFNE